MDKKKILGIISVSILLIWLIIIIYPFVWAVFTSLKSNPEIFSNLWGIPTTPRWSNYVTAWTDGGLGSATVSSVLIAVPSIAILAVVSPMASYVLSRKGILGKDTFLILLMMGMFVAPHIMMVALYRLMIDLGVVDTYLSIILVFVGTGLPYVIFITRPSFLNIPQSMEDAARIDGIGTFKRYWKILLPLAKPGLIVGIILEVIFVWNNFFFPLILLRTPSKFPLPLALMQLRGTRIIEYGHLTAGVVISAIPMVIMYLFFSDQIRKGIAARAGTKG